jgi:signal transduction histidine kinase
MDTARLAVVAACVVAATGGLVLVGWALDVGVLKSIYPGWTAMKPITAVCLILGAGALACLVRTSPTGARRVLAIGFAVAIAAVGLLTIMTYADEPVWGRELSPFRLPVLSLFLAHSVRMAVNTALGFAGLGAAMILLASGGRRAANVAHALTLALAVLLHFCLVGYVLDVQAMYRWLDLPIALHTDIALLLLCTGLLCVRTDTWLMAVLTSRQAGGMMARWLLPTVVLLPLVIGWLRVHSEEIGLLSSPMGTALVAISYTFVLLLVVWLTARSIERVDASRRDRQRERQIAAEELHRANRELEAANAHMQHSLERFELLADTAGQLLQADEPQTVVESLCRGVMEHLDCHAFFNFLVDERAGKLHLNACAGVSPEQAAKIEWLEYGVAVCGCAASDGCRIVAEHIPSTPDPRTELVKSFGIRAYACHPLLAPGGKVIGTLSFGTRSRETYSEDDLSLMKAVTDLVAVAMARMMGEHALRRTAEDLVRSNRELEQFAYIASHDLQEPLRAVEGFLARVISRYPDRIDARASEYIGFAIQGAQRMSQLVYSLLEYSRVQGHGLAKAATPMKEVFEQAAANCQAAIADSEASVTCGDLPVVMGDPTQLVQLLQNLIANAVKFRSPHAAPQVRVNAEQQNGHWIFHVRDNGIGIPPQQAERVFLIFQRLHRQEEYPGAGIGLAICKKIVQRHGGQIRVESKVGEGSDFLFTIPA